MFRLFKLLLLSLLITLSTCFVFAWIIGNNFTAKLSGENSSSYRTILSGLNLWDFVNFRFTSVLTWTQNYTGYINFYNNFSKESINLTWTCNNKLLSDKSFVFSWNWDDIYDFDWIFVNSVDSVWENIVDANIMLTGSELTNINSVKIYSNQKVSLQKAYTQDYDGDGFLDWYRLVFSSWFDLSVFDKNKLTVSLDWKEAESLTFSGKNWKEIYISYKDNVWNGGKLPQVELEWYASWWVEFSNTTKEDVNEVDEASPIVYKVNWTKIVDENWDNLTWEIDINKNDNINIEFSEAMRENTVYNWIELEYIDWNFINGDWSKKDNKSFSFSPDWDLEKDVEIKINPSVLDLSSNWWNSVDYVVFRLNILDTVAPYWENIIWLSTGILLDWGSSKTVDKYVDLNLAAVDTWWGLDKIQISNFSDFSDKETFNYQETIKNWELTSTNTGVKTVYVKFFDYAGNESEIYSDSIEYNYSPSFVEISQTWPFYITWNSIFLTGNYNHLSGYSDLNYRIYSWSNIFLTWEIYTWINKTWTWTLWNISSDGIYSWKIFFQKDDSVNKDFFLIRDTIAPNISVDPDSGTFHTEQEIRLSMDELGSIYYSFTWWDVINNWNLYTKFFVLNNDSSLYVSGVDKAGNITWEVYNFDFECDPDDVENGSVTSYPECEITCDSGYHKEGTSCVKDSSGWWGWGWWWGGGWWWYIPTCDLQELICKNWVYYRKSWVFCKWWKLWEKCEPGEEIDMWGWDEGSADSFVCGTITKEKFEKYGDFEFAEFKENIIEMSPEMLKVIYTKILDKIKEDMNALFWQSKISKEALSYKSKIFYSFTKFFEEITSYKIDKSSESKKQAKFCLSKFLQLKRGLIEYRDNIYKKENNLYKPVNQNYKTILQKVESKIFGKINKLKTNNQIDEKEFENFKNNYNKLIFAILTKDDWVEDNFNYIQNVLNKILYVYNK